MLRASRSPSRRAFSLISRMVLAAWTRARALPSAVLAARFVLGEPGQRFQLGTRGGGQPVGFLRFTLNRTVPVFQLAFALGEAFVFFVEDVVFAVEGGSRVLRFGARIVRLFTPTRLFAFPLCLRAVCLFFAC